MHQLKLKDNWLLASETDVLGESPQDPEYAPKGWMEVDVPTTVQAALVESGRVPPPWKDRDAELFEPFEDQTWWYRTQFEIDADATESKRFELVFDGISLLATIWLNGTLVGFTHNAHYAHRFDVTRHINTSGTNVLAVECRLGLEDFKKRVRLDVSKEVGDIKPYMRMAGMTMGWDFAPRLPLIGLWRSVTLEYHTEATVEDIYVATESIDDGDARLRIETNVNWSAPTESPLTLELSIHEKADGHAVWEFSKSAVGGGVHLTEVDLKSARLWWPQPLGEPFLYTLRVVLGNGERKLDSRTTTFGVRTVELNLDDQMTFVVNGRPVFARGANWVPPNTLTLEASHDQYRHLLKLASEANFNMLRVWGGGIYEADFFYQLCDELGIMVWQDFMYACSMYPDDDPWFMESVETEAKDAIRRIRRHPSLALWCGNNECQEAWELGDWPERTPRHLGERLYDNLLPSTVSELNSDTGQGAPTEVRRPARAR